MKKILIMILLVSVVCSFGKQRKISIKYGVSPFSDAVEGAESYNGLKHFGAIQYNFKNYWSIGFEYDNGYFGTYGISDAREVRFESTRYIIYGVKEIPLFHNISFLAVGGFGVGYFDGSKEESRYFDEYQYPYEKIDRESGFVTTQLGLKIFFPKLNFGFEIIPFDLAYGNLLYSEFSSKISMSIWLF